VQKSCVVATRTIFDVTRVAHLHARSQKLNRATRAAVVHGSAGRLVLRAGWGRTAPLL
jgi:hypothetical protein